MKIYDLDELDKSILRILNEDSRTPVQLIAEQIDTPASTVHYRLKKMRESRFIEGYYVKINPTMANRDYMTVIQVRAREGAKRYKQLGKKLTEIDGVWAVYFILGDWDFILLSRTKDRISYLKLLDKIMHIEGIERTSSLIVAQVLKEDPRIDI